MNSDDAGFGVGVDANDDGNGYCDEVGDGAKGSHKNAAIYLLIYAQQQQQ